MTTFSLRFSAGELAAALRVDVPLSSLSEIEKLDSDNLRSILKQTGPMEFLKKGAKLGYLLEDHDLNQSSILEQ